MTVKLGSIELLREHFDESGSIWCNRRYRSPPGQTGTGGWSSSNRAGTSSHEISDAA